MSMRILSRREFGLGVLLFVAGCGPNWRGIKEQDSGNRFTSETAPDPANLIGYLNKNAEKVNGLWCEKVELDCKQGGQPIGLTAIMACQKPRNFRLKATVAGQNGADIGSNDQEFWYWVSKADPPHVFHCSYQDLAKGGVRLPFPFQPEMILTALGIAEYDTKKKYEVRPNRETVELIESTVGPTGEPITKITVFNKREVPLGKPQVVAHVLRDKRGKDICVATIQDVTVDRGTGAVLPQRVKIVWPGEKPSETAEMVMRFYDLKAVALEPQRAAKVFSRQDLVGLQTFDLARWAVDTPGGIQPIRMNEMQPK